MNSARWWMAAGVAVGLLGLGYGAYAQTGAAGSPQLIPYQGYLEDGSGPLNVTDQSVTFFITSGPDVTYSSPCDGTAGCLWAETDVLNIANGYFSTVLGDGKAFPSDLFASTDRYLGVLIGEVELVGKQKLLSSPYSIRSVSAQGFRVAGDLGVGSGLVVGVADPSGAVDPADGVAHINTGLRIGNHANVSPAGSDLVVAGGVEIGDHSGTTNPVPGSLWVQGDVNIGGRYRGWTRQGYSAAYNATGSTGQSETAMKPIDGCMCFLSWNQSQTSSGEMSACYVYPGSSTQTWTLFAKGSGTSKTYCEAQCICF